MVRDFIFVFYFIVSENNLTFLSKAIISINLLLICLAYKKAVIPVKKNE